MTDQPTPQQREQAALNAIQPILDHYGCILAVRVEPFGEPGDQFGGLIAAPDGSLIKAEARFIVAIVAKGDAP